MHLQHTAGSEAAEECLADQRSIDAGFASKSTGYANGDFNYSGGPPNSDDYFVIDLAYSTQSAPLAAIPEAASDTNIQTNRSIKHHSHHRRRRPQIRANRLFSRRF